METLVDKIRSQDSLPLCTLSPSREGYISTTWSEAGSLERRSKRL